jgi:hypothetical protein
MADYWGLDAIARRLGVNRATAHGWWQSRGLLMYRRHIPSRRLPVWYSNDQLIQTWELTQCALDREHGPWRCGPQHKRKTDSPAPSEMTATAIPRAAHQRQISAAP